MHMSEHIADDLDHMLQHVVMHASQEAFFLAQLEHRGAFDPAPADLEMGEVLDGKLRTLKENLGGPPRVLITFGNDPRPEFDFYVEAAIDEMLSSFDRARTSVCRTYMYRLASDMIEEQPERFALPDDADVRTVVVAEIINRFWEHAETSFIRLASYWDRVGQLLDFAYFNIRRYERDGFAAVMNRIRTNIVPVSAVVGRLPAWDRLRRFQNSANDDGLEWLVRRRNLLIHSLHLSPLEPGRVEDPIFTVAHNHLEAAVRDKLKPGDRKHELGVLLGQLQQASNLFPDNIEVALAAPESLRRRA